MVKRNIDSLLPGKSAKSAYRSCCSMVLTVELVDGGGGGNPTPVLTSMHQVVIYAVFILNH